jgi:hypothetical protein
VAAAEEIIEIVREALGSHVSELRLHPQATVPGIAPSQGWESVFGDDAEVPGISLHPGVDEFGNVLPSIMEIALGAPDRTGTTWHEIEHVFENAVATDEQLDDLHNETDSIRPDVGKPRGLVLTRGPA